MITHHDYIIEINRKEVTMTTTKKQTQYKKILMKYIIITCGCIIYSSGISLFLDPNQLAPGGVSGIAIIASRFIPIETGTLILFLNIPLLLLGVWKLGFSFFASTFYAVGCSTIFINFLGRFNSLTEEPLLAALAGAALVGTGIGIIFKVGATTGGIDIIVRLLRLKYKHLKTGFIFMTLDIIIVTLSAIVFGDINIALYAGIAVAVNANILDMVLYGKDEAKLVYIISDQPKEIAIAFLEILDVGVTYLEGSGGYSNKEKQIILCAMRKQQYPKAEEIVKQVDPSSFIIVTNATEIYGEGYKNIFADKL